MLEMRSELLHLLPRLRRFCIALLGNRDAADELLVERMRVFVRQGRRPKGEALRIELFQCVVDGYRVRSRSTRLIGATPSPRRHGIGSNGGGEPASPGAGAVRFNGTAFAQALRELDPEDRAALLLKDLEEMTYGEAARVMKEPVEEVKSRHHRAHRALRRMTSGTAGEAIGSPGAGAPVPLEAAPSTGG